MPHIMIGALVAMVGAMIGAAWWLLLRTPYFLGRTVRMCRACIRVVDNAAEQMRRVQRASVSKGD